ncbi:MAG TPA: sigma-70 family RNA polymerase sigma factor [Verrucomicrobiae bacterium]
MAELFDPAWLQRVRENDAEASTELVRELYPLVMRIVRGHLPRRMDPEDLAQIVFVKVFQKIEQYHGDAPFPHWVSRIAVNTCLNELRAEKARPELRWADLGEEQAEALQSVIERSDGPSVDAQVATRDLADRLLETLPPRDRLILTLLDLEERTVAEVSKLTGSPEAVVKVRAFRARRKLRKELERLEKGK